MGEGGVPMKSLYYKVDIIGREDLSIWTML
jgi:hypothetical protein